MKIGSAREADERERARKRVNMCHWACFVRVHQLSQVTSVGSVVRLDDTFFSVCIRTFQQTPQSHSQPQPQPHRPQRYTQQFIHRMDTMKWKETVCWIKDQNQINIVFEIWTHTEHRHTTRIQWTIWYSTQSINEKSCMSNPQMDFCHDFSRFFRMLNCRIENNDRSSFLGHFFSS